jgi:TPR repeat protein
MKKLKKVLFQVVAIFTLSCSVCFAQSDDCPNEAPPPLESVPDEILLQILSYLDVGDLGRTSLVNKHLNEFSQSRELIQVFYKSVLRLIQEGMYGKAKAGFLKIGNQLKSEELSEIIKYFEHSKDRQSEFFTSDVVALFEESAKKNNPLAQYNLGQIYELGYVRSGPRGTSNYEKAAEHFQLAANLGHAGSQQHLGNLYFLGLIGTEITDVERLEKAEELFRSAAHQGDRSSILRLKSIAERDEIELMDEGEAKSPKLFKEIAKLLRAKIEKGSAWALRELANMYQNGQYGQNEAGERDLKTAIELFHRAAAKGSARAKSNLKFLRENAEVDRTPKKYFLGIPEEYFK